MSTSRTTPDAGIDGVVAVCGSGGSLCLGRVAATVGIPEVFREPTHIGVITETIVSGIH